MKPTPQKKRVYDHRLREYVRKTGDVSLAKDLEVPRSTINGWLHGPELEVVSHEIFDMTDDPLVRQRILKLERRLRIVTAVMILLQTLCRISKNRLDQQRLPEGADKKKLLSAIERGCRAIPIKAVLSIVGISPSRYHIWCRGKAAGCSLDDRASCPAIHPTQLTPEEVRLMHEMAVSDDYRHVPTSRLGILAQRLGKVFASPSTWLRYARERDWRRPRTRVHPSKPTEGIRTNKPDGIWHVDVTVVRLVNGSKAYIQAIIDNYSRRILAYRVSEKLEPASSAELLVKAYESRSEVGDQVDPQAVMVDGGIENFHSAVMKLVEEGLLALILAQTAVLFSNSMIEGFWRVMKHQWLFLNQLDSVSALERLVRYYVEEYNRNLPHSAFDGQTPDEMYFGHGDGVPDELAAARASARQARLEANRELSCESCPNLAMAVNG